MSRNLVAMNAAVKVVVNVGARPVAAVDGVDITNWRINGLFSSPLAVVLLDGSVAATVDDPAHAALGPEVWGYVEGRWSIIGVLNNNQAIALVAHGQGFAQEMDVIGIFERLAIAGTVSAGVVTATIAPMESFS